MKKRMISLALVVALIAIMLTSFTMAYFTDTDKAVNTMTFGKVGITLNEQMYDEAGELVAFDDSDIKLLPAVLNPTAEGKHSVENKIDKIVTVTADEDSNDAYVRVIYAYEGTAEEFNQYVYTFVNGTPDWDYNIVWDGVDTSGGVSDGDKTARTLWIEDRNNNGKPDDLDGFVTIAEAVYASALKAGETTAASLKGFFLSPDATAEGVAAHFGDAYDIYVVAQAVQADGFVATDTKAAPRNALDEAFGNIWDTNSVSDQKLADWFGLTLVTASND